jgi:hypothetical protein
MVHLRDELGFLAEPLLLVGRQVPERDDLERDLAGEDRASRAL